MINADLTMGPFPLACMINVSFQPNRAYHLLMYVNRLDGAGVAVF
jgi:hypothetical protein